ncbi:PRC-barrel domain containing protein [Methylocystis parvus]|uniref:PRC-barrel domain containing protein n=2 Tax=Methylocystis parvus TaxID=134 RepID=A0A6B8M0L3_9HYPH|nr:PRC-barrel domain containing protein [Methylocystis parvus]
MRHKWSYRMSKSLILIASAMTIAASLALAEAPTKMTMAPASTTTTEFLSTIPSNALLVSNIYDRNVYDAGENKLGEIKDIVIDRSGTIGAVIVSVGGFLGVGDKDVAVAFEAVNISQRNNKTWLSMNTTKAALMSATGFKFDKSQGLWTLGQK